MTEGWALGAARRVWTAAETIHALIYFAPESDAAARSIGLTSFWRGYFAMRAAPFGAVGPAMVTATFFNFHPAMVERAIPAVWERTSPRAALDARALGASAALRRVLGDADGVATATDLLRAGMAHASAAGRALYAANLDVPWPGTLLGDLWHATTLVREHRGDGHNAALVARGLDGCEAHVLTAATGGAPRTETQPYRGWSDADWDDAVDRLRSRGLVDGDGAGTDAGHALKATVERATDEMAARPWLAIGADRTEALLASLQALARRVARAGVLRYPNPIGLAPLE